MKLVPVTAGLALFAAANLLATSAAMAQLSLSQLVVELGSGDGASADVEILNTGPERAFVAVDPREIIAPGTSAEAPRFDPDPEKLGLLVSPARIILEPGQRRLLRIAALAFRDQERVYRVTVKPVTGPLKSESSGLKVLVGYDMLVLVRPAKLNPHVSGERLGSSLALKNDGNVSVELDDGKECDSSPSNCRPLPGGRLYAGAQKMIQINPNGRISYKMKIGRKVIPIEL
jgi:P pilus assembly chaperone PapD